MDPENIVIAVAAFSLVLLGSFQGSKGKGKAGRPIIAFSLFVLALSCTSALSRFSLTYWGFTEDVAPARLEHYLTEANSELSNRRYENIIIFDGGSYSARGLDGNLLESLIRQEGYDLKVIQVTLAGANHFERFTVHQGLVSSWDKAIKENLVESNVIFAQEVNQNYDKNPLSQFERDGISDRSLYYLSISNFYWATKALFSRSREEQYEEIETTLSVLLAAAKTALMNFFQIGRLESLRPRSSLDPLRAFVPQSKARVQYEGYETLIPELEQPYESIAKEKPYSWLEEVRNYRLDLLYGNLINRELLYQPPSLWGSALSYTASFERQDSSLAVIKPDLDLYQRPDGVDFWADRGHLLDSGARVYTEWLAEEIISSNLLVQKDQREDPL